MFFTFVVEPLKGIEPLSSDYETDIIAIILQRQKVVIILDFGGPEGSWTPDIGVTSQHFTVKLRNH